MRRHKCVGVQAVSDISEHALGLDSGSESDKQALHQAHQLAAADLLLRLLSAVASTAAAP